MQVAVKGDSIKDQSQGMLAMTNDGSSYMETYMGHQRNWGVDVSGEICFCN